MRSGAHWVMISCTDKAFGQANVQVLVPFHAGKRRMRLHVPGASKVHYGHPVLRTVVG
jgi:hypothetical protein